MPFEEGFIHFPVLETTRLKLRQLQMKDEESIFAIKSDPEVTKYYGAEPTRTLEEIRKWIEGRAKNYENRDVVYWVCTLKEEEPKDRAIAAICLWNFDHSFNCAEIGYELNPSYWNRGITSEALAAIITYSFNNGLNRIEANPLANNEASKKILSKLGFKLEGTLRQRIFFRGEFLDQTYFGLLREEWIDPAKNNR